MEAAGRGWSLALVLGLLLSACSTRDTAERILLLGSDFERAEDIAFGDGPRQTLDVYRPEGGDEPRPVIVFLYGGRWQSGSKDEYRLVGRAFTRRGFVTVVPDYRHYPEATFPAWVRDAADAVRWTRDNVSRFGGDPDHIVVVGHSAGAHTAALLALDERYLNETGGPNVVRGVVSLAGPVDTTWTDPDVQALMGPPEGWPATYADNHVSGTEPPILLLHGAGDETVSPRNSVGLASLIEERGGCARAVVYPGVGHIEIVVAMMLPWLRIAPVLDDVTEFARSPGGQRADEHCPGGVRL